jgi:hypothetical protein
MTKYLNHEAFDIVTNDAACWIGFLFADGSVIQQQKGAPQVQLRLSEIDRGHLEKFRQFLDSTHAITTSPPGNFGGYQSRPSARYAVTSRRLAGRLLEMGRYDGPIAPELTTSRHFWRGVVDGDGSIFIPKTGYSSISLMGCQRLLEAFLRFLTARNLSGRMTIRPHKSIHGLSTAGYLAELIIDELYRNATRLRHLTERQQQPVRSLRQCALDGFRPRTMLTSCVGDIRLAQHLSSLAVITGSRT